MQLYNIGQVPWADSQLIYHALARLGREGLALVSPASPYVCLGFQQNPEYELDLDYCRSKKIPFFRRDVGGGAVYLDGDQFFFQLVLKRDNPKLPPSHGPFYRKYLQPAVQAYRRIGINAEYKPINDIVAGNRKISGTGAGEIGDCVVFVGNLILDFDYRTMARVLKAPDERFRGNVQKAIVENLSTIKRELGSKDAARWSEEGLNQILIEEYEKLLGPLQPARLDDELKAEMRRLKKVMLDEKRLFRRGRKHKGRVVKIRAGLEMIHRVHQVNGGRIRTEFSIREGRYSDVDISADFQSFPKKAADRLARSLEGLPTARLADRLDEFPGRKNFYTLGVDVEDWMRLLAF